MHFESPICRTHQFLLYSLLILMTGCSSTPEYFSQLPRQTLYVTQVRNQVLHQVEFSETKSDNKIAAASNVFGNCTNAGEVSDADLIKLCELLNGLEIPRKPVRVEEVEILIPGTEASRKKPKLPPPEKPMDLQEEYSQHAQEYAREQGAQIELVDADKTTQATPLVPRLETGIKEISFIRGERGKVKSQDKFCLKLNVQGNMIFKDQTLPIDIHHRVGCKSVADWDKDGMFMLRTVLADKLRSVSSLLLDEFSLIYRPVTEFKHPAFIQRENTLSKHYPDFVLAATKPALRVLNDDEYHKLSGSDKVSTNWYFGIPVADSLNPELSWESFPMAWDANTKIAMANIANVSYELNVYEADKAGTGMMVDSGGLLPGKWVYRKMELNSNSHKISETLQACKKYFWTVRARFRMSGAIRFTEWGGLYDFRGYPWKYRLKGSQYQRFVHPSRFYYMFQTPAEGGGSCT